MILLPTEYLIPYQHLTVLPAVAAGPDSQVRVRFWDAHFIEENLRHPVIVVLPGVEQELVVTGFSQCFADRRRFDELWTGTNDRKDFHAAFPRIR